MALLIEFLLSNIRTLIPFTFIYSPQQGVFYRLGKAKRVLEAGVHFRIPYVDNISVHNVTYRMSNLPTQSYLTGDKMRVTFSACIGFSIFDALLMECNVEDLEATLNNFAMGWLATQVNKRGFDEIITSKQKLEDGLVTVLNRKVRKWGVEVHDVGLTDFTDARAYRLYQTE